MDTSQFNPQLAPGQLVPTVGYERRPHGGMTERVPVHGTAFVPDALPPSLDWVSVIGHLAKPLLDATSALARLDGVASRLPNPHLLLRPLWTREAKYSSQIEDTIATVEEVAIAGLGKKMDRDDPKEVWNYVRALEHGLNSSLPLCNRLICQMHEILLDGVRGQKDRPGVFRDVQVYIGDRHRGFANARFVPPPPNTIVGLLTDFERFINTKSEHIPALIAIALAHYQFETIHPFRDGNGRLGRLLISLSFIESGMLSQPLVYVSAYMDRNKQEYQDHLLRVSTHAEWEPWIRFFLDAVTTQAKDTQYRSVQLIELHEQYRARIYKKTRSSNAIRLIDHLFISPATTVGRAKEYLGVGYKTAKNNMDILIDAGILEEITGSNYGRIYIASEILDAVEEDDE